MYRALRDSRREVVVLYLIIAGGGRPISAPQLLGVLELKSDLRGPRFAMAGLGSSYRMVTMGSGVGPMRLYFPATIFCRMRWRKMNSATRRDMKRRAPIFEVIIINFLPHVLGNIRTNDTPSYCTLIWSIPTRNYISFIEFRKLTWKS